MTLGSNLVYINSGDTMPQLNGSETYTRRTRARHRRRPTYAHDAASATAWNARRARSAPPALDEGRASAPHPAPTASGMQLGVFINENSDAIGTGNFIYEFIGFTTTGRIRNAADGAAAPFARLTAS